MIKFTKLIRDLGLTLGGGRYMTGNRTSLMSAPSRIYGSPKTSIQRSCNMASNKISQRSKAAHDVGLGTMGDPRRKSHGFRGLVVECFSLNTQRGPGIRHLRQGRGINSKEGVSLNGGVDTAELTGSLT